MQNAILSCQDSVKKQSTVQYSTVQYSTVQFSIVQYSTVSTVLYSAVQYNTVEYSAIQYSRVQCNTVQYSTVQYSTVQYSTVQYSTVQYSTVQNSTIKCSIGVCVPYLMPNTNSALYRKTSACVSSLITLFKPGQSPPHVTIAARTSLGTKCVVDLGPARMKASVDPLPLCFLTMSFMM